MTEIRTLGEEGTQEERRLKKREREVLRDYLRLYQNAKRSVADWQARLEQLRDNIEAPIGATKWQLAPGHSGMVSDPTSAPVVSEMTAEEKLELAIRDVEVLQREIADVIALLPSYSPERRVLELKYIDGMMEWQICEAFDRGRTMVYEAEQAGLDALLKMPSVRRIIF